MLAKAEEQKIDTRSSMHIWMLEPNFRNNSLRLSAILEIAAREPFKIWFEIPDEFSEYVSESAEPFVLGAIFSAMGMGGKLHVHGHVSQSLLRNLSEFQAAWHNWLPNRYKTVQITADDTRELPIERTGGLSISAFTGGVDSCYTIYRHRKLVSGAAKRTIEAGLLIHGFDIPLEQEESFSRAASAAQQSLSAIDTKLITMKSNLFNPDWENTHGAMLAACLMTLQGRYEEGLIASSYAYTQFHGAWGSNPITDHLLSSRNFPITHDGSGTYRGEKLEAISQWEEGFNNLRVCFSNNERDKNCGVCPKCVMTLILCRSRKLSVPRSFPRDFTTQDILSLDRLTSDIGWAYADTAQRLTQPDLQDEPWMRALTRCARFNKRRLELLRTESGKPDHWRKMLLSVHELIGLR